MANAAGFRIEYRASLDGADWYPLAQASVDLRVQYLALLRRSMPVGPGHVTATVRIPDVQLASVGRRYFGFLERLIRPGARFLLELLGEGQVYQRNAFFVTRADWDHLRLEWRLETESISEAEVLRRAETLPAQVETVYTVPLREPETWTQMQEMIRHAIDRQVRAMQQANDYARLMVRFPGYGGFGEFPSDAAEAKGRELLLRYLSKRQKAAYVKSGEFLVRGESGRAYVFGRGAWIIRLYRDDDDGRPVGGRRRAFGRKFCIGPEYGMRYPKGDVLLAQKLLLEADEKRFLRSANDMGEVWSG